MSTKDELGYDMDLWSSSFSDNSPISYLLVPDCKYWKGFETDPSNSGVIISSTH